MIKHGPIQAASLFHFTVPDGTQSYRIDRFVAELFPDYSRSFFQRLIDDGNISINGSVVKKSSSVVQTADTIAVQFPAERIVEPAHIIDRTSGIQILAETDHFIVIHKPANLLVHAPSSASNAITVVDWIRHNYAGISTIGAADRPGIIHRLDRETSGLLLITKTNYAHNLMGALFRNRHINKTYKAVVQGHPPAQGTITFGIGRDPYNPIKMAHFNENHIDATGKIGHHKVRHAKTDYTVVEYFDDAALVEVKPTTGRTHQIRVHMAAIGHPIIGDQLYGKKSSLIQRQALHAESLSFEFEGTQQKFTDALPEDFQQLIFCVRSNS